MGGAFGDAAFEFGVEAFDGALGELAFGEIGADADDVRLAAENDPPADDEEGDRLFVDPAEHDFGGGFAGEQGGFDAVGHHRLLLLDHQAFGFGVEKLGVGETGQFADEAVP